MRIIVHLALAAGLTLAGSGAALAKRCPVSVILRGAGCRIEEQWSVTHPTG